MGKTNAELCRDYYYRKKAAKEAEKKRQGLAVEKPIKKTGAERNRAYRLRKKLLSQLAATSANTNQLAVSVVSSSGIADHDDKSPFENKLLEEIHDKEAVANQIWEVAVEYELQEDGTEEIVVRDDLNNEPIGNESAQAGEELENLEISVLIYRVYKYLQKEYEDLKALNASRRCDPSPLANILKRTAEATGVSELVVTAVVIAHESDKELPPGGIMSEHNYYRRQSKSYREADVLRIKEEVLEEGSASGKSSEECGGSRPETTPPVAPPCQISKTPAARQHDDGFCLKQIKIEPPEGEQTEQESIKISPAKHQRAYSTRQKYNEMNARAVQSPEYRNRDDVKMEIEEYMFILAKPSDEPTTGDPMGVTIKVEPQHYS